MDLCDKRVVSFVIGDRNNNSLVFSTFDSAAAANPDAHPLFHSDRGYQYTSRVFHQKLVDAGMTQSMSRVAHYIVLINYFIFLISSESIAIPVPIATQSLGFSETVTRIPTYSSIRLSIP